MQVDWTRTGPGGWRNSKGQDQGETARNREAMRHGLLSLMAASEDIGHVLSLQASTARESFSPHAPGERAFDAERVCSYVCGRVYSDIVRQAMDKDDHGLAGAGTVGAKQQLGGLNIISTKVVFTCMSNEHGCAVNAKARSVARGSNQRQGIEIVEISAPTLAASWFRLLGAGAFEVGLDVCHCDAEQALLQSILKVYVFMRLPTDGGKMSGKVVRMKRSLYGLKQALRTWHNHLISRIKRFGLTQSPADACLMLAIKSGSVSTETVVAGDMVTVELEARCDQLCTDLTPLL